MKILHAYCTDQHRSAILPVLKEMERRGHAVKEIRVHSGTLEPVEGQEYVSDFHQDVFINSYPHILRTAQGVSYKHLGGLKVCVEHGINPIAWAFPIDRHHLYDVICCAGKWQMQTALPEQLDEKCHLTGWPKTDRLLRMRKDKAHWRSLLEQKMRAPFTDAPVVAWVPTHSGAWERTDALRALSIPNLVIAPHERRYADFRRSFNINYGTEYPYYIQTSDIYEVLAAADVVVTDYSSAGIEALAVKDLPIIQILSDVPLYNRDDAKPLTDGFYALSQHDPRTFKLGANIANLQDLPGEIAQAAADPLGYWKEERDYWRAELLHDLGNATRNVCDLLERKVASCKVCGGHATYHFSRAADRPDLAREVRIYTCDSCGMLFTDAWDDLTDEQMAQLYEYPLYLQYDIGAAVQRRLQRTHRLVHFIAKKYGMEHPKVLMHGSGSCLSPFWLTMDGFDVYTSFDHLPGSCWSKRIDPSDPQYAGFFDIICSIEVAEHFAYPIADFQVATKLLAPGGVFCGTTCFFDKKQETLEAIRTDEFHYTHDYHWNGGLAVMYTELAMDRIAQECGCENRTERGEDTLRKECLMPATSYFFQLRKR